MLKIIVIISIVIVCNVYSQEIVTPEASITPEMAPTLQVTTSEPTKPVLPEVIFKEVVKRPSKTICAVNGVPIVVTDKTPFIVDKDGTTYYFLNEEAKKKFQMNDWKYKGNILTCQVCGTQTKKGARGTNFFQEAKYGGRTYYFCSNACKSEFLKDPEKYSPKPIAVIVKKIPPKPKPPLPKVKKPISPTTEEVKEIVKEVTTEVTPEAGLVTPEVAPTSEVTPEVPITPKEEVTKE